jgi:hypothetical protein
VRCVYCPQFERKTRHCRHYNVTIKLSDIHRSKKCDGYDNVAKRKWLLNVAHREALPEAYYQVGGL